MELATYRAHCVGEQLRNRTRHSEVPLRERSIIWLLIDQIIFNYIVDLVHKFVKAEASSANTFVWRKRELIERVKVRRNDRSGKRDRSWIRKYALINHVHSSLLFIAMHLRRVHCNYDSTDFFTSILYAMRWCRIWLQCLCCCALTTSTILLTSVSLLYKDSDDKPRQIKLCTYSTYP